MESTETQGVVCTGDACAVTPTPPAPAAVTGPHAVLDIEVISDVICPWCYIGKRHLERALALLGDAVTARVTWRPYQLNPTMPRRGMDRRAYRSAKFGSWERSQAMDAQVAAAGAAEGIAFNFDGMTRTPNTLDGHRLVWLARGRGSEDAAVEALFRAYFAEGRDVNDPDVLVDLAGAAGIGADEARAFFGSGAGEQEVLYEESLAKGMGGSGVPTFVVNGTPLFAGAVPAEQMAAALRKAAGPGMARPARREMTP